MPRPYTRIHRLLHLLALIQSERGWNARRLSEELDISERNIYRDIKMLEGAGIPVHYDEETGGYRIERHFFMPPVELTFDESLALVMLAEEIGHDDRLPFTDPASRASTKIRAQLPAKLQNAIDAVLPHVEVNLAAGQSGDGFTDVYQLVRAAIATRRKLRCRYESIRSVLATDEHASANDIEFFFRPYCLFYGQRAWYAVGLHEARRDVRTLKLSRFVACELTDKPYAIPDDFSLRNHLGRAWRMIRGDTVHRIELQFAREVGETVADTHWHDTQRIEWHDDGRITFRCEVAGLDEIVWWILSYGPLCRAIRPRTLVERVQELAAATADQYAAG